MSNLALFLSLMIKWLGANNLVQNLGKMNIMKFVTICITYWL